MILPHFLDLRGAWNSEGGVEAPYVLTFSQRESALLSLCESSPVPVDCGPTGLATVLVALVCPSRMASFTELKIRTIDVEGANVVVVPGSALYCHPSASHWLRAQ